MTNECFKENIYLKKTKTHCKLSKFNFEKKYCWKIETIEEFLTEVDVIPSRKNSKKLL